MCKTHRLQFIERVRLYLKTGDCSIRKDGKCIVGNNIESAIDAQIKKIRESRKSTCKMCTWNSINGQVLEPGESCNEWVRVGFGVFPDVIVKIEKFKIEKFIESV